MGRFGPVPAARFASIGRLYFILILLLPVPSVNLQPGSRTQSAMVEPEQQPANAEAMENATTLLQDLRAQGSAPAPSGADVPWNDAGDDDEEAEALTAGAMEDRGACDVRTLDEARIIARN